MSNKLSSKFLRVFDSGTPSARRSSRAGEKVVFILSVFIPLFFCVWLNMKSVKINYELIELKKKSKKLEVENRTLEYKLQTMVSGEKIEEVAKQRYGFVSPVPGQVRILKKQNMSLKNIVSFVGGLFGGGAK